MVSDERHGTVNCIPLLKILKDLSLGNQMRIVSCFVNVLMQLKQGSDPF